MINNTENYNHDENARETNGPSGEARASGTLNKIKDKLPKDKFKELGQKAYSPLLGVVHKYSGDISPYINAMVKGLESGADSLTQESADEKEKFIGSWFREAADGLREARTKLESTDIKEIVSYVETQGRSHPSFMFTSSYLAGLFFGRIGRHMARTRNSGASLNQEQSQYNEDRFDVGDQSLH